MGKKTKDKLNTLFELQQKNIEAILDIAEWLAKPTNLTTPGCCSMDTINKIHGTLSHDAAMLSQQYEAIDRGEFPEKI